MKRILTIMALMLCFAGCSARVKEYKLQVVKEYPHDHNSYTQGLFFSGGKFYESTGQYGHSKFREVDLETGKAIRNLDFNRKYFAEGSVMLNGKLFILTWESNVAFIYDAESLQYLSTYTYPREGWGLTTDGKHLIASDGTSKLYFMDEKFAVSKTLNVTMNGRPIKLLNELEYIDGKIWANVYTSDLILIINPDNGSVEATVDCTGLLPRQLRETQTDVLNGIAYNPETQKIYLTGKNWKRLYEVKLVPSK